MFKRFYSSGLKKPVFDIKSVIGNINGYKQSIHSRQLLNHDELALGLENLPLLFQSWKDYHQQLAEIQVQRKAIEKQLTLGKKFEQNAAKNSTGQSIDKNKLKNLKLQSQNVTELINNAQDKMNDICDSLPNLVHHSCPAVAPVTTDWINPLHDVSKDNQQESYVADPRKDHISILTQKGLVDFSAAASVSGTSFYYLFDEAAQLEQALIQYAVQRARAHGFRFTLPPSIARMDVIHSCGFRPRDDVASGEENQIYHLSNTDKGLIATAEITLAGLNANKVFHESAKTRPSLPLKLCGLSKSFRKEAGARGKDTKGLYRVHEFSKVELFIWCRPEESETHLLSLKNFQMDMIKELGLTAKVMNMPANDLGAPAFQKYDIECWMPGRGSFGETSSTSNCTDFQSRRMNTRFISHVSDGHDAKPNKQNKVQTQFVHTLNGTAMAIPRIIMAIVENFYNPQTKMVAIPKPLQPFMNNKTHF
ncbi:hypothetical protein ACO0RG_000707 [Hanseniaspora osmophila]|uniref:serine--tRNA ligase n=1 Tax=Hanseniaspora osmophila TaxID=56408 RepID=A0A1E5R203_9ASCO|nr:Serine--tRNA ligase, mitochondrial [Hanseniaspora osmophila]